jgi:6-phospho-beta-glucosidase
MMTGTGIVRLRLACPGMRVTIIGAGGFRTPLTYRALLEARERLGLTEVVLHDTETSRLATIEAVLAGIDAEHAVSLPRRRETEVADAVRGAAFVLCAIRVGGLEGRIVDETVPLAHGVLGQETVGPGGIAFALRTLPAMRRIAEATARHAPDAWLVNFTNPAGLITEALTPILGDRVVGICDSPDHLAREVAAALGARADELAVDYAGLNHLGWVVAARRAGRDLLPDLLDDDARVARLPAAGLFGAARLRELRAVPNEYLVYFEQTERAIEGFRREGATRGQTLASAQGEFYAGTLEPGRAAARRWRRAVHARNRSYMREARTETVDEPLEGEDEQPAGGYEAAALAVMEALAGAGREVLILNVRNGGALPFLDRDAVVEVPAVVGPAGPRPLAAGVLPPEARDLVVRVKEVERLTIRAAAEGSRALALEAIAHHPLVPSAAVADAILSDYLDRQPALAAVLADAGSAR